MTSYQTYGPTPHADTPLVDINVFCPDCVKQHGPDGAGPLVVFADRADIPAGASNPPFCFGHGYLCTTCTTGAKAAALRACLEPLQHGTTYAQALWEQLTAQEAANMREEGMGPASAFLSAAATVLQTAQELTSTSSIPEMVEAAAAYSERCLLLDVFAWQGPSS